MIRLTIAILNAFLLVSTSAQVAPESDKGSEREEAPYIPRDLDDAVRILKEDLSEEDQHLIRKGEIDAIDMHLSLGMALRNSWGLWGESRLAKWFQNEGVSHPDGMSGYILEALCNDLLGEPFVLKAKILDSKVARLMNYSVKAIYLEDTSPDGALEFLRYKATEALRVTSGDPNDIMIFEIGYNPNPPHPMINYQGKDVPLGEAMKSSLEQAGLTFEVISLNRIAIVERGPEDQMTEQASSGQPATSSESKSEGSDKPQPESEGRSR